MVWCVDYAGNSDVARGKWVNCHNVGLFIWSFHISALEKALSISVLLQTEMDTLRSDLKLYDTASQFGLLGPEDSDSFRMDSKPQPCNDLNIKLRDEMQRYLTSKEQNFNVAY